MGTFADEQVLYNNNPSPTTAVGLAQMRYNQTAIRELPGASAPVIVEITDGAISPTSAFVRVDTEGQAEGDELEVISPVLSDTDSLHDGMILYLQAADQDRVVTVRSTASANGIQTFDGQDVVLDTTTWLVLQLRQGTWYEMRELSTDKSKVALDGSNVSSISATLSEYVAHAAMPTPNVERIQYSWPSQSNVYVHPAPADGYWSASAVSSTNGGGFVLSSEKGMFLNQGYASPGTGVYASIPVSKGDKIKIVWGAGIDLTRPHSLWFIYANGSAPTNP